MIIILSMNSTGYFRSRNMRKFQDKDADKQRIPEALNIPKPHIRNNSSIKLQTLPYKSALVFENRQSKQIIHNYNIDSKRQIASLTKIMTCLTALQFIQANCIVPQEFYCRVSRDAAELKGTTAGLHQGNIVSLWDLLHGLMLPSGNDAAYCIAENLGKIFISRDAKETPIELAEISPRGKSRRKDMFKKNLEEEPQAVEIFVREMNRNVEKLEMRNTRYTNPHGLSDSNNYSTCRDQLLLIRECLKNSQFQKIVRTKLYFGYIRLQGEIWTREIIWENTNRLLGKGYQGIKTGNTSSAGHCLASWFCSADSDLIIIILGCPNKEERDFQTLKLTSSSKTMLTSLN